MTDELKMPSERLAKRLLSEVTYDERLVGVSMHCLQGPQTVNIYSLETAGRFLYMDTLDALKDPTSGATLGYIDPIALAHWLGWTLRDRELADRVERVAGESQNFVEMLQPLRELIAGRLAQCQAVLGEAVSA